METLGFILFGVAFLVGVGWLVRQMSRTKRNESDTHGGGIEGTPPGIY